MDLNSIKSQLDATESQLSQYGANLPSEIETQVQSAYTPLLERSLGVTKDLMSDYLGRAMETTSMGPGMQGTSAYDLSPSQRMGVIGRELGTMGGQLNSAISYSDYLGGQMNDLYGKAVQAAQLGQQNLADQYARQMQEYQMAWQEAENAKARAAAGSGGGGWRPNPNDYLTTDETKVPRQEDLLKTVQQVANSIASQRGKTGGTYSYGGETFGNINQAFNLIMDRAKNNYNLNLNPQWLWQQLGNTPAKPMSYNALL